MKKSVLIISSILFLIGSYSCKKKQDAIHNPQNNINSVNNESSQYLKINGNAFNSLKDVLEVELNPTVSSEPIDTSANIDSLKSNQIELLDLKKVASESNAILSKHKELNGFKSMLRIYNEALSIEDVSEREKFVNKYPNFMSYIKEINFPLLKYKKSLAALLNENAVIQIEDEIVVLGENSISTIKEKEGNITFKIDSLLDLNKKSSTQLRSAYGQRQYRAFYNGLYGMFLYKSITYDFKSKLEWNGSITLYIRFYSSTEAIPVFNYAVTTLYYLYLMQRVGFSDTGSQNRCNSINSAYYASYMSTECYFDSYGSTSYIPVNSTFYATYGNGFQFNGTWGTENGIPY